MAMQTILIHNQYHSNAVLYCTVAQSNDVVTVIKKEWHIIHNTVMYSGRRINTNGARRYAKVPHRKNLESVACINIIHIVIIHHH
jgi:hypothetical protein